MKFQIQKEVFLSKLIQAIKFLPTKLFTSQSLQGVFLKTEKGIIHLYSSNLSSYFHTQIKAEVEVGANIVIDPRKVIEFVALFEAAKIDIELREKQVIITDGKTKGSFPIIATADYPLPPTQKGKGQKIKTEFLQKKLPLVLFAASQDESRPALNGVQFLAQEETLTLVTTDGFRLSLLKTNREQDLPSINIPSGFLSDALSFIKGEKEVIFDYLEEEKMILFKLEEVELYSRLIQGDFPPYEKVIPTQTTTTVILDRKDLERNTKLVSVFARDYSNVIVLEFKKTGLEIRPKTEGNKDDVAQQDIKIEGEEQKVAFNYKYLLEFLARTQGEKIKIEILRADAPVVFKMEEEQNFLHIIMPVRIQE